DRRPPDAHVSVVKIRKAARAAAWGDTLQKMGKNRPRGRRPKVAPRQTPHFIYQPGMKIVEGKSRETPCAKKAKSQSTPMCSRVASYLIRNITGQDSWKSVRVTSRTAVGGL